MMGREYVTAVTEMSEPSHRGAREIGESIPAQRLEKPLPESPSAWAVRDFFKRVLSSDMRSRRSSNGLVAHRPASHSL